MGKNEISYKAGLGASQALGHLEDLVRKLKAGSVCLQVGGEHVSLTLDSGAPLELSLSASQKKGKNRLSLELSWKDLQRGEGAVPAMVISSEPPAPEPSPAPAAPAREPAAPKAAKPAAAPKTAAPKTKRAASPKRAAAKKSTRKKAASAKTK
ncbi:MAG: amphi-Trp domain-containing protein [Desulfarculaceae bacterium]|nr:amphi-Trp domain-containing protein [Desulfarculaceae bacterium]